MHVHDADVLIGFTDIMWTLASRWKNWQASSKWLTRFWLIYFIAPFAIGLVTPRSVLKGAGLAQSELLLWGMIGLIRVIMTLAPKPLANAWHGSRRPGS